VIMVLAAKLKLYSVQCDITAALVHGRVPEDEEIYVHQPRGFYQKGNNHVLKLKCTLYGLKQAPRYFFKYFTERLIRQGLTPSEFDPCLFFGSSLIVIIYVDDILIYGKSKDKINDFIERMKTKDVALYKEGTAEGYLGVDIQCNGDTIIFTQGGHTKRIIKALGPNTKYSTAKSTPADNKALGKDPDSPPASGKVNYASVIGMLLYLNHSRRYTFGSKKLTKMP
jgi:hypothetical protein